MSYDERVSDSQASAMGDTVSRSDPDTGAYLERRTAEGKTKTEAIRCIKRYIAREVFAVLPHTAAG